MNILFVAIFGGIGGVCRYIVGINVPIIFGIPIANILINITGSFLLPFWNNYLGIKFGSLITVAVGSGFIGAFTTFSGMILDIIKMYNTNNYTGAFIYLVVSMIFGLIAASIGFKFSQYLNRENV